MCLGGGGVVFSNVQMVVTLLSSIMPCPRQVACIINTAPPSMCLCEGGNGPYVVISYT